MINFIDENNKHYNAPVEYGVRHGVNGEKSVSGIIYANNDVLLGIDRGWRMMIDNEYFVVTYAMPKDYGNVVETSFDAVHEFFYDFAHDVAYTTLSNGSHTFKEYMDFIFAGSGYSYSMETTAFAMVRQGFGNKLRLDLFNDVIKSAGVEFAVQGKTVRIVERVGSDLTTKVEKRFNMQDLQIEKQISNFITYKRGYGAWLDDEDHSQGRLTAEYESPLAQIYGRLHAEPITDERYTVMDNLIERLQADVEGSYAVSVQVTMEDLTKSGYVYEHPRAGDWIMAINDDINFRQKIRIVSYESVYAVDGTLKEHRITCNSIGAVRQLEGSSAGIKSQVNDLANRVDDAEREILRVISGAGNTGRLFYGNVNPGTQYDLRAGDMWIDTSGETTIIRHWNGYEWELTVDTSALQRRLDTAEGLAQDASEKADIVADAIDDALVGTGHITLADLLASKMVEDDFETLFFQQSDAIGFTYSEEGIRKAIIAIIDGNPYIKGEHVMLDGDTLVRGDFTVTGDMLADGAIIGELEATGIDAQDVQIVNLNASNISGGNLELANGLSITHNGKVIFGVNASNQIQMDEEIRDELKGADGTDGADGADGRGVDKSTVDYKLHTSGTQPPTGTWLTTPPTPVKGQYLWTRTVITYTDGSTPTTTYSVAYNATDGTDGVGVSTTTVDYAQTTSGTTTPTGWNSTRPAPIKGQYLWTRTIITYTDGTKSTAYSTSYSALDGVKGEQGPQGAKGEQGPQGPQGATGSQGPRGATGTSVESVTEYYLATSASSGIVSTNAGFTTTMQPLTPTNKYLWNYEKINFSDGTDQPTIPVIIGVYGDKGQAGSAGATGATGRSIVSITEHYLATSASTGVTRSTAGWSTTMQPTTETNRYLWNYETINWSSGTTPTYVEPIIIGVHGAKGPQGIKGADGTDGQSQYVHIRYSANANGSSMTTTPASTTKYIGIAITNTATAPGYTGFTWSKYVGDAGAQGPQGVQGPAGANGAPTYTWIKYADTPTSGMNDFADGKKYIGLAFNKTTATESTSYSAYQWSLMPQNIEISGRNLLLNSGELISNGTYNIATYTLSAPPIQGEEMTFTLKGTLASTKTDFRIYNSGGSVSLGILKPIGNGLYSLTFNWNIGASSNEFISVYAFTNAQVGVSEIEWAMLTRGNLHATDWTEAPEDTQARIDAKTDSTTTDTILEQLSDFVTVDGYEEEIGEINTALNDYKAMLEAGEVSRDEAISNITTLLDRTAVIESDLGEFTQKWKFLDTNIIFGAEGIMIGDIVTDTGIRIAPGKIDFVDNGTIVADITGQYMKINRGIFVKSATIGEHKIETIAGGHTIFNWVPN